MDIFGWSAVILSAIIVHFYLVAYELMMEEEDIEEVDGYVIRVYAWLNVPIMLVIELVYFLDVTVTSIFTVWDYRSISAGCSYFSDSYGPDWRYSHNKPYEKTVVEDNES